MYLVRPDSGVTSVPQPKDSLLCLKERPELVKYSEDGTRPERESRLADVKHGTDGRERWGTSDCCVESPGGTETTVERVREVMECREVSVTIGKGEVLPPSGVRKDHRLLTLSSYGVGVGRPVQGLLISGSSLSFRFPSSLVKPPDSDDRRVETSPTYASFLYCRGK